VNVYVETNFVLELALQQENSSSCEELLDLCDEGKIHVVIPAFSLAEPHEMLVRQANRRKSIQLALNVELTQLSRSAPYSERLGNMMDLDRLLLQSSADEQHRFNEYCQRLLGIAETISLTAEILVTASIYENRFFLSPQDAIVYASVVSHLETARPNSACFLSSNSKDFGSSEISSELTSHRCRVITNFEHGLSYIRSQLKPN